MAANAVRLDEPLLKAAPPPAPGTGYHLLLSHALTKLGSKGWEFATPLLLLTFTPDSLVAPTVFGLAIFLVKFAIGPAAGAYIDRTPRMIVVRAGIGLQSLGVVGALVVLRLNPVGSQSDGLRPVLLLCGMVLCGWAEVLGATLSSVSIRKDWVPTAWAAGDAVELATINSWMASIDLVAEMVGPILAGVTLSAVGGVVGFAVVGLFNVVSFAAELLLLRRVFDSNQHTLGAPRARPDTSYGRPGGAAGSTAAPAACCREARLFLFQPGGIPVLVFSYALCWFSVLSPHGIILTAYLQTRHLSPAALAVFRASGAASGGLGILAFQIASRRRSVRRVALLQLCLFAGCVAAATACFRIDETQMDEAQIDEPRMEESQLDETHPSPELGGASAAMLGFLLLLAVSRSGCVRCSHCRHFTALQSYSMTKLPRSWPLKSPLPPPQLPRSCLPLLPRSGRLYGFDTALLQLQQLNVDESLRGTVGAIESSLCALGTLATFAGSLASADAGMHTFGLLVYISAGFVCASAVMYTAWCVLWHEHAHVHPEVWPGMMEGADGRGEAWGDGLGGHSHAHEHSHPHPPAHEHEHNPHAHTTQQLQALRASPEREHTHLHFHPLGAGGGGLWRRLMGLRAEA